MRFQIPCRFSPAQYVSQLYNAAKNQISVALDKIGSPLYNMLD